MLHHFFHNQADIMNPSFKMIDRNLPSSGYLRMSESLTLNGVTVLPDMRIKGTDAGEIWPVWTYGSSSLSRSFNASAGGLPNYYAEGPLAASGSGFIQYKYQGDYHSALTATMANIGTDDFAIEFVTMPRSISGAFFSKMDFSNRVGWALTSSANNTPLFFMRSGNLNVSVTCPIERDQWSHWMIFCNRNETSTNGLRTYRNGAGRGTQDPSTMSAAFLSNNSLFTLNYANTNNTSDHLFSYFCLWHAPSWFAAGAAGSAQFLKMAKERFALVSGIYPTHASGTPEPVQTDRNSRAYLYKVESDGYRYLYNVGVAWPRICSRPDFSGVSRYGYLPESQKSNYISKSHNIGAPPWGYFNCTTGSFSASPDKIIPLTGIIPSTADSEHYLSQSAIMVATNTTFSAFVKAGTKDYCRLNWSALPAMTATFAIHTASTTGSIVSSGSGLTSAKIEKWGNNCFRVECLIPALVSTGSWQILAGTSSFAGDGTNASIYVGFVQSEPTEFASSPIVYDEGLALSVRLADQMYFTGGDGNIGDGNDTSGTLAVSALFPSYNSVSTGDLRYTELNRNGTTTDRIHIYSPTTDVVRNLITSGNVAQANQSGQSDPTNGVFHELRTTWKKNDVRLFYNKKEEGTRDLTASIPEQLNRIYVGYSPAGGGTEANALISNIKVFIRPTRKS